jgi:hypothetical protein
MAWREMTSNPPTASVGGLFHFWSSSRQANLLAALRSPLSSFAWGLPLPRMMRRRNIFVDELKATFQKLKPELAIDLGHTSSVLGRRFNKPSMIGSIGGGSLPLSLLILGTRPGRYWFTSGAPKTGCYHVDASHVGNRSRIDPDNRRTWPVPACRIEASRRSDGHAPS